MIVGRGRREQEQGHGSGISIGGDNIAPLQNVVGENISHVYQSASGQAAVDAGTVRDLLASFRADVDRNAESLDDLVVLRAMAERIDAALAVPDPQAGAGSLQGLAQALPSLVLGTAVQQGGEALANALAGWAG
ncbi:MULTISPECIES: hypothetical protein [unclassified Streptomyces]|uniref:hypothetical protein n=1 Tax=Streptomyces TaxID=1883 RepID=UPI000CD5A8A7|nr:MULTISPECIES: hypothetical protein [unclassified Streptomyces]